MRHNSYSPYRGYELFLVPGVLLFLGFIVIPFCFNIGFSFTKWGGVGMPEWNGLGNYNTAIHDAQFWESFEHNLYLVLAMTIIPTALGLFLAAFLFDYVARHFGPRTASFFRAGFYLPQIIPLVIGGLIWRWIYQPDWGALNWSLRSVGLGALEYNWLGKVPLYSIMGMMVWFQLGYPLVIFMAGLQRLDPELYEAASIDGASWFERFRFITIPSIRPEISVVVLVTTIDALKTFAPVFALTGGRPTGKTMVASYFSYKNFFQFFNVGYGATMSTVLTALIILFAAVYITIQLRRERVEVK
jgi:raffinose/stachyose/melibiose transport system permease protein